MERFARTAGASSARPRLVTDGALQIVWSTPSCAVLSDPLPLVIKDGRLVSRVENEQGLKDFFETLTEVPQHRLLRSRSSGAWIRLKAWADLVGPDRLLFFQCATSVPLKKVEQAGLAADFGLTKSECLVLNAFAKLRKPPQIARDLNVSLSTVRSHLKQIHVKMGVNSSLQLLQLTRTYCDV